MKYAIIFDLDGTLLDTLADLTDATNYALAQFGCPARSIDYVRSIIGNGALRQITLALPGGENDPQAQDVLKVYKEYYSSHCDNKTVPYDGILQALQILKCEYPLAIVTNKPHGPAKMLCDHHFPGILAMGEQAGIPRKPNRDMVDTVMAQLGVQRCIYVGDSEVDVRTAENVGVPCLAVTWGLRTQQQLTEAGATHFCHDPAQLPAAIRAILENTEK